MQEYMDTRYILLYYIGTRNLADMYIIGDITGIKSTYIDDSEPLLYIGSTVIGD